MFETIERVKAELPAEIALLGFCGAPWTVATYMVAGQGTSDQAPARLFAYRDPEGFGMLIDRLVDASTAYLCRQIDAGVDAVQIFDSWAGILAPAEFRRWAVEPFTHRLDRAPAHPGAKIIGFPKGAGAPYETYTRTVAVDAVGLDWTSTRAGRGRRCRASSLFRAISTLSPWSPEERRSTVASTRSWMACATGR